MTHSTLTLWPYLVTSHVNTNQLFGNILIGTMPSYTVVIINSICLWYKKTKIGNFQFYCLIQNPGMVNDIAALYCFTTTILESNTCMFTRFTILYGTYFCFNLWAQPFVLLFWTACDRRRLLLVWLPEDQRPDWGMQLKLVQNLRFLYLNVQVGYNAVCKRWACSSGQPWNRFM